MLFYSYQYYSDLQNDHAFGEGGEVNNLAYHRNITFLVGNRNLLRTGPLCAPAEDLQQIRVHEHVAGVYARHFAHACELRDEVTVDILDEVDDSWDVVVALTPVGTNLLVTEMLHELKSVLKRACSVIISKLSFFPLFYRTQTHKMFKRTLIFLARTHNLQI